MGLRKRLNSIFSLFEILSRLVVLRMKIVFNKFLSVAGRLNCSILLLYQFYYDGFPYFRLLKLFKLLHFEVLSHQIQLVWSVQFFNDSGTSSRFLNFRSIYILSRLSPAFSCWVYVETTECLIRSVTDFFRLVHVHTSDHIHVNY